MELSLTLCFSVASLLVVAFVKVASDDDPPVHCSETDYGSVVLGNQERAFVCNGVHWGTVCRDNFGVDDASVLCKQLGRSRFGPEIKDSNELNGAPTNPVIMKDLACSGSEERLIDCGYSTDITCHHGDDVAVICSPRVCIEYDIRLVDGTDVEGRVEICLEERWHTLCQYSWDPSNSKVLCRQLGYRSEGAATLGHNPGPDDYPIYQHQFNCDGDEKKLFNCEKLAPPSPPCVHNDDLTIRCNSTRLCTEGEVRLAGGNSTSGRVEVCMNEEWGTVCGDSWSDTDARVVCRQLGLSRVASFVPAMGHPNPGSGFIHIRNVTCQGSEPKLLSCDHNNDTSDCSHQTDAQVTCLPRVCENGDVRLADGPSQYEGRLEICRDEMWGTVCNSSGWMSYEIKVACRELGFGIKHVAALEKNKFAAPPGDRVDLGDEFYCVGDEVDFQDCDYSGLHTVHDCGDPGHINLRCGQCAENNVTLTPVGDGHMRVEMCLNGRWGTICGDDSWDNNDAAVLCRQFNMDNNGLQLSIKNSFSLLDPLPVIIGSVSCTGGESSLTDCNRTPADGDCPTGVIAGVQCSAQLIPSPASPTSSLPSGVTSIADSLAVSTRPHPVASPSTYLPSVSSYTVSDTAVDARTVAVSSYTRDFTVEYCNFQLVCSGNIVCSEWLLHHAGTKLEKLSQGLVSSLEKECNCGLTLDYLTLNGPICLQQNQFVLPGVLTGTNSVGCRKIMEHLQNWAGRGSVIVVEGVPLTTVKECSVYLEPGETPSCKVEGNITESTREPLLDVILLPCIVSVLGIVALALVIIVVCIVVCRVRRKKANVRLSQLTPNPYNMVAISGQTDDGKIVEIYDSADYCSSGIYEKIAEPLPPIPPNENGIPLGPNPYLSTTLITSDSPAANGSIPRLPENPRGDQNTEPGTGMYSYIDVEAIAARNHAPGYNVPDYDVPTMDDNTGSSHYQPLMLQDPSEPEYVDPPLEGALDTINKSYYQPLQLGDSGPEYVDPPLNNLLGTVVQSHYQPLKLIQSDSGAEYETPPLENSTNNSHYQPLQPVLRNQLDPPQISLPATETVVAPASGDPPDTTVTNTTQSSRNLPNYQELIVQESETNGEYASLNI